MTIQITKATLPAWYEHQIGEAFEVEPEPYQYSGGTCGENMARI